MSMTPEERRARILARGAARMDLVMGVTKTLPKADVVENEVVENKNEMNGETPKIVAEVSNVEKVIAEEVNVIKQPLEEKSKESNLNNSKEISKNEEKIEVKEVVPDVAKEVVIEKSNAISALQIQIQINRLSLLESRMHLFFVVILSLLYTLIPLFTQYAELFNIIPPLRSFFTFEIIFQSTFLVLHREKKRIATSDSTGAGDFLNSILSKSFAGPGENSMAIISVLASYLDKFMIFFGMISKIIEGFARFIVLHVLTRATIELLS